MHERISAIAAAAWLLAPALAACNASKDVLTTDKPADADKSDSSATSPSPPTSQTTSKSANNENVDVAGMYLDVGPVVGADDSGDTVEYGFVMIVNGQKANPASGVTSGTVQVQDVNNGGAATPLTCSVASQSDPWNLHCPVAKSLVGTAVEFQVTMTFADNQQTAFPPYSEVISTPDPNVAGSGVPPVDCGAVGGVDCYTYAVQQHLTPSTTTTARTPVGVVVYQQVPPGFAVWGEKGGYQVLAVSGQGTWQMRLQSSGKGYSTEPFDFSTGRIGGRVCPPNVYIDDNNQFATGHCLYFTEVSNDNGPLSGAWTTSAWYEGNVSLCANVGMRLPTLYETTAPAPTSGTPAGNPVFAGTNGVPIGTSGSPLWTATSSSPTASMYWVFTQSAAVATPFDAPNYARCVLP